MVKAAYITQFGGAEVVTVGKLPGHAQPKAGEGEVLIKVHAAGINPVDWKIREGYLTGFAPHKFPLVLGWDLAGEVVERGHSARRFEVGDKVWAFARRPTVQHGTFIEYVSLPESYVALAPPSLSLEEAAAVPLAALTAYQGLFDAAELKAGETVLVLGASGGVGAFVVQLAAKARGTCTVIGVASTKHHDYLQQIGAHHTLDYRDPDFVSKARQLANGGDGVDVVFDAFGEPSLTASLAAARRGARVVSIAGDLSNEQAAAAHVSFTPVFVEPNARQLDLLSRQIEDGHLRVHVDRVYPFDDVAIALDDLRRGGHVGKLVLKIAGAASEGTGRHCHRPSDMYIYVRQ